MSNVVTGCSSVLNFSAVELMKNCPKLPLLHDHLAAIIIAKAGVLVELETPSMYYRQHGGNVEGAKPFNFSYLIRRTFFFLTNVFPRYKLICKEFDISLMFAVVLKVRIVIRRLRITRV